MPNDLTIPPETVRLMRAGLNDVLYADNNADMRNSAVLAAQETLINTVKALGKSAGDILLVLGMLRAKKPRNHAELAIACQIILAEDTAVRQANMAVLFEKRGDVSAAMRCREEARKANANALRYATRLMRLQGKRRNNGPVRSAVGRNMRW